MTKIVKFCEVCDKEVIKYKSQVNGKRFYCSKVCKAEGQKTYFVGENNPNYKDGSNCTDSICVCGSIKDYRAKQCNRCFSNIERYFQKDTPRRNGILWRYIESYNLLQYKSCTLCGQNEEWNGKILVLQLDHIDGNAHNNEISNLRVLCPNCHTQTETYASRNKGKYAK